MCLVWRTPPWESFGSVSEDILDRIFIETFKFVLSQVSQGGPLIRLGQESQYNYPGLVVTGKARF